jgi:Cdc6-like AAA superfamily ATPase
MLALLIDEFNCNH